MAWNPIDLLYLPLSVIIPHLHPDSMNPSTPFLRLTLTTVIMYLLAACQSSILKQEQEAEECAIRFAQSYYRFELDEALNYCTEDSRPWVVWLASNISQTDIDSIRQLQEAPTVKLLQLAADTAEDNARAYLRIQHFYSLDSLGKPGQTIEQADICLQLHFESNEWKVRMVGPPQSGK